jgi:microcystin-dependent protein
MADQFVAEIRMFAGNFAPLGWAFCNGQLLPISQNTALFSLLGTSYGGNGMSTFGLPNLQGSAPIGAGQGPGLSLRILGEVGGEPTVTLLSTQLPAHAHTPNAVAGGGTATSPAGAVWASQPGRTPPPAYASNSNVNMAPGAIGSTGGGLPHNNMPPYQVLNFIIALQGIYPSRP